MTVLNIGGEEQELNVTYDLAGWCIRTMPEGWFWTGDGFDDDPWHATYFRDEKQAQDYLPEIPKVMAERQRRHEEFLRQHPSLDGRRK